jgi:AraC-like DNA-binding protein
MSKQPYANIKFDWLGSESNTGLSIFPSDSDYERREYDLPNDFGSGSVETITLAFGMTLFRAEHQFQPNATGQIIPAGEVQVQMNEPTFQAQIIRGGRVLETQISPAASLLLSPGVDMFRYSNNYEIAPSLDGSSNSQMTCLSIGISTLKILIGESEALDLLSALALSPPPKVVAKDIPLHISAILHNSINNSLVGNARKLNCQARALDYLSMLVQHIGSLSDSKKQFASLKSSKRRSHDVHNYLVRIEGKVPTLDNMAKLFGCSARTLNDEFNAEFGESIYSFITNQRLLAAHELIKNSNVALKEVAFRLGYAHVNHFITAFKNKFGYSPGSLRK